MPQEQSVEEALTLLQRFHVVFATAESLHDTAMTCYCSEIIEKLHPFHHMSRDRSLADRHWLSQVPSDASCELSSEHHPMECETVPVRDFDFFVFGVSM
jgi:hypothetical protein